MRTFLPRATFGVLAFLLIVGCATSLHAQQRDSWTIAAMGGRLDYDFADDNFGMIALRADFPVSSWTRFEFESSLARVEVQSDSTGNFDPDLPEQNSSLATISVGFQAGYRTRWVEPYMGFSIGFFWRLDEDGPEFENSVRSNQTTFAVPAGLRVFLTDRLGLRAEVRMRSDQAAFGVEPETNWEKTLGISWTL